WLALAGRRLPGLWWRVALLALALLGTWTTHRTLLGRDAGVTLVVVLLALKTLELRARRDAFVVFFLGFFAMLTNFFHSQSLLTALAMLLALLGLLTALVNAHMPVGRPPLAQAARTAGGMALAGAPIMLALFLLFPRMAPLWGTPNDTVTGRSGLSGTMRVGSIAELALDDGIAARIRFEGDRVPAQRDLYFRGPVLERFDGREWSAPPPWERSLLGPELRVRGEPVRYEVTMEPSNRPWLLTLDAAARPPEVPGLRVTGTPDLQWLANRPIGDLLRYRAESHTRFESGPLRRTPALRALVALPPGANPRTVALAARMRADPALAGANTPALVQNVLRRLATGGYSYTLEPGVYGKDTADEFWFDRREGFCEHIASAFVVLMRALDIPARIVTGYQGGELNGVDGFWVLRQSDAHAWAEVWQEGTGWVRVDPTASVAPGRVGAFQRLARPPGLFAGANGTVSPDLAQHLRAAWEAVNNRWNQWVLNYTQSRQLDLLKHLGFDAPSPQDLASVLLWLLVAASAAGAGLTLWERHRHDPWLRLLAQARDRLRKAGLDLPDAAPPRQMAQQVLARFGATGQPLHDWLLRLEAQRYAPSPVAQLSALRAEYRRLDWPAQSRTMRRCLSLHALPLAIVLIAACVCPTGAEARKSSDNQTAVPGAANRDGLPYATRDDAMRFADDVAARRDLDRDWVRATIGSARLLPNVPRLMLPAPRGTAKNWRVYRSRFIDPVRIAAGVRFWRDNANALALADAKFGVPPEIIVGIVGVETIYGRNMGSFRVLDALATLAFDFPQAHPRAAEREAFFRGELESFLSLESRTAADPRVPLGSYAGAMGMPQFMPSSIAKYAIDFDGDGRIDLVNSPIDVIGSVANYFKAFGWQPGMPATYPVRFDPATLDKDALLAPDILPSFSVASFQAKGALLEGEALRHKGPLALIELQNGDDPPSYVAGTENFYVITRYNWSSYYAMSVLELGREIAAALEQ
ncbi:MAG: transglutaminase protein, partial [Variovorax sp.]|nr:transglutaminase protein [Variovorax sp.]